MMEEMEQGKDLITEIIDYLGQQGVPTVLLSVCSVILAVLLLILFVYLRYIRTGGGQLMLRRDMAVKAKHNSDLSASLALEFKQRDKERSERTKAMLEELRNAKRVCDQAPIFDKYMKLEEQDEELFIARMDAVEKAIGSFQEENSRLSLSKKELKRLRRGK